MKDSIFTRVRRAGRRSETGGTYLKGLELHATVASQKYFATKSSDYLFADYCSVRVSGSIGGIQVHRLAVCSTTAHERCQRQIDAAHEPRPVSQFRSWSKDEMKSFRFDGGTGQSSTILSAWRAGKSV